MELTELERDILHFALDYTYEYLSDIHVELKWEDSWKNVRRREKIEEQIEALKILTKKLLS